MGLAAGQARLLTITGRKSDCEFQSMRLSHQKIALARQLADLSNEYQNSLNQTKLIYDYYGTGDTTQQLSYGIMMSPSALNDYMPLTMTNSTGRIVLDNKYAAAAERAGIPREGLGTLPSEFLRNKFIDALGETGVITENLSKTIQDLPYNQAAGFGGGATVVATTKNVTIDELLSNYLSKYQVNLARDLGTYNEEGKNYDNSTYGTSMNIFAFENSSDIDMTDGSRSVSINNKDVTLSNLSLADLLSDNISIGLVGNLYDNKDLRGDSGRTDYSWRYMIQNLSLWDTLNDAFAEIFAIGDGYSEKAIEYAQTRLSEFTGFALGYTEDRTSDSMKKSLSYYNNHSGCKDTKTFNWAKDECKRHIGMCQEFNKGDSYNDGVSINLTYMIKAYLTWYADFLNGVSKTDAYGNDKYNVDSPSNTAQNDWNANRVESARFVTDDKNFVYTIKTGSEVSSDDLGQAKFYDALFNQICANGWTCNDNVNDNEYLQNMLQNGMMFISRVKDDGYYYQGNYSTDKYIKEIADETKIAQAEAKYNTEKAKLNAKEETIDLKMKNLDTEISSLTTEYDTVKNTISKNIEKAFKRYA